MKNSENFYEDCIGRENSVNRLAINETSELAKFQAFYDLAVAMTANRTLDQNLKLVVTKAMELLAGDASYIALRDDDDRSVYMHTVCGIRTEAFKDIRVPYGMGVGGKIATTGQPYIVEDYFRETEPLLHDLARAEGLVSGVAVPIQIGGVNLGVLYVFNRTKTTFTNSHVNTLSLLGNLAAVEITRDQTRSQLRQARDELEDRVRLRTAQLNETNRQLKVETVLRRSLQEKTVELKLANMRLVSEISERIKAERALAESESQLRLLSAQLLTAQEDERKRVARELHDGIGQLLTAIKFRLENIQRNPDFIQPSNPEVVLKPIINVIQDSIEEVRRISMALRPSILDDLGISATINWFCREFLLTYSGITMNKVIKFDENLVTKDLKTVIFRIFQEALNNVAKHSRADHVRVELSSDGQNIRLAVTDNGVGLPSDISFLDKGGIRGVGMASMRERAESMGGTLEVQSVAGKGTTIHAQWRLFNRQSDD